MTDKAIGWLHAIRAREPDKPRFTYYSTGCSHAPDHVPAERSLLVNGERVGGGRMDHPVPFRFFGYAGGRDAGLAVERGYADRSPFSFTGTINKVVFDVDPHLSGETAAPSTSTMPRSRHGRGA